MALTTQQGAELADQVRAWLRLSGQAHPSVELQQFIDDLESAQNVSVWAGVDYDRILPLRMPRSRIRRTLSVIRNAMVFLPVLLTWWALREASRSFSAHIAALPDGEQANFLVFWESMHGLARLSTVALIDAAIIVTLVALSLVVGLIEESGRRTDRIEEAHEGLMVALERNLSGYRYLTIADINAAASGTLQSLLGSSRQIEAAATSFAQTAEKAHDAIVVSQSVVTRDFAPIAQRLDTTIQALGAAAGSHQDMADLVTTMRTQFGTELAALQTGFASLLSRVDADTARIAAAVDSRLGSVSDTLATASDSLRATFSTLEFGIQRVREDLDRMHHLLERQ